MTTLKTLARTRGYKLVKDSTFPDAITYCILSPDMVILAESSNEERVRTVWNESFVWEVK